MSMKTYGYTCRTLSFNTFLLYAVTAGATAVALPANLHKLITSRDGLRA